MSASAVATKLLTTPLARKAVRQLRMFDPASKYKAKLEEALKSDNVSNSLMGLLIEAQNIEASKDSLPADKQGAAKLAEELEHFFYLTVIEVVQDKKDTDVIRLGDTPRFPQPTSATQMQIAMLEKQDVGSTELYLRVAIGRADAEEYPITRSVEYFNGKPIYTLRIGDCTVTEFVKGYKDTGLEPVWYKQPQASSLSTSGFSRLSRATTVRRREDKKDAADSKGVAEGQVDTIINVIALETGADWDSLGIELTPSKSQNFDAYYRVKQHGQETPYRMGYTVNGAIGKVSVFEKTGAKSAQEISTSAFIEKMSEKK